MGTIKVTMENNPITDSATVETTAVTDHAATLVEEELLVEEISIDGMCGVY